MKGLLMIVSAGLALLTSCSLNHDSAGDPKAPYSYGRRYPYHRYGPSLLRPDADIMIPSTGRNEPVNNPGQKDA